MTEARQRPINAVETARRLAVGEITSEALVIGFVKELDLAVVTIICLLDHLSTGRHLRLLDHLSEQGPQ